MFVMVEPLICFICVMNLLFGTLVCYGGASNISYLCDKSFILFLINIFGC